MMRFRLPPRSAQCRYRATPAVHRTGAAAQSTRQAAGAPSARSQPSPPPSRDRADGATLGRRDAHASRRIRRPAPRDATKREPLPAHPAGPTASRTRDSSRGETDGQAGRPPPQCAPERRRPGDATTKSDALPVTLRPLSNATSSCLCDARPLRSLRCNPAMVRCL